MFHIATDHPLCPTHPEIVYACPTVGRRRFYSLQSSEQVLSMAQLITSIHLHSKEKHAI